MTFGESISTCFSKYATFEGRASKSEFWWFYLLYMLVYIGAAVLDTLISGTTGICTLIVALALMLPFISVSVRRYHDSDHSGWWYWCPIMNFVLLFYDGTYGDNEYGPKPE